MSFFFLEEEKDDGILLPFLSFFFFPSFSLAVSAFKMDLHRLWLMSTISMAPHASHLW